MPWRAARDRLRKTAEKVTEEVEAVLDEFAPEAVPEIRLEPVTTIDVTDPVANPEPPAPA